ncbi:unnamed protein product [Rotaria sordida]|uniref:Uncharacterized protein n=1 Tax=Rotaria sordida TaxID=392033 RepID=A0A814WW50_9BILA|nr:unnamed protein product [Rotaria sordida]CAF1487901.1 unnamed protein product [Rotaria sordida]
MIIARFLTINVIDQLFEHYNQNHSKILIIGYLKLNIKKFQSSSRKSQRSITRTRNIGTNEQHLSIKNDKDSSIISNTNKDTKVNFERLLSTTLFSIKSVVSLISTQHLLKNLEETLNYFKSTFNVQKSIAKFLVMLSHNRFRSKQVIHVKDLIKHGALSALEPVVYDLFLVETLLELVRYNKTLQFLTIIVDSVRHEGDKWKMFFTTNFRCTSCSFTITCYSTGLSKGQSLLDIYSTQVILFDVVSSFELRPIDPFIVAFRASTNRNVSLILFMKFSCCLRDETFSKAPLRILHDVILRIFGQ